MMDYVKRNVTTKYTLNGPAIVQYGQSDTLLVEMIVKVPQKQEIKYVAGFWQVIKFAWIQYVLVFLFWYCALYRVLLGYLVQIKFFDCVEVTNINNTSLLPI